MTRTRHSSIAGLRRWRWDSHKVFARTKSEARARLKTLLGLGRLPKGSNVVEI